MILNTIFAGTSSFAVPALSQLTKHYQVLAVITQPDRPAGRGLKLKPSPVKEMALKLGIDVYDQPINELADTISKIQPDLIIVVAYGQILKSSILAIPRFGVINAHGSLLPKYRGASPIQAAILNGDDTTGVTIMQMAEKMDAGPIISQASITIDPSDTAGSLHDKLADLGADLLIKTLRVKPARRSGGASAFHNLIPQEESNATYTKKITKADALLNLTLPAATLERQIRAYNPWPGTFIEMKNEKIKMKNDNVKLKNFRIRVLSAQICDSRNNTKIPTLKCGDGKYLVLTRVQPPGKKPMGGEEFARGYL